ncbi:MAG TPA: beta-galactosidase [Terriglobia bacterium]|nr:beta-galactosidase [Terriglobia bacterium]
MKHITRRKFMGKAGWGTVAACSPILLAPDEAVLSFAAPGAPGKTAVLDDFETAGSLKRWDGQVTLSREHASHGLRSLKATLFPKTLSTEKLPKDWQGYDRLLLDIFNPEPGTLVLGMGIYDELADDATADYLDEAFRVGRDLFLIPGMNHIEVELSGLQVTAGTRGLALDKVRKFTITAGGMRRPVAIYVDNLRLVKGAEGGATASLRRPEDGTLRLGNGFIIPGQVGPHDAIPESASVKRKREEARKELIRLKETIAAAQMMGLETIYHEIPLVTAELGLDVRTQMSWFNNDKTKSDMFDYVTASCRAGRLDLDDLISGSRRLPETDDTQVGRVSVPAYPQLRGLKMKDGFFVNDDGDPLLILSLHSPSKKLTRFFATPFQHIESYTAGGGSRWTIDRSPVYAAFKKYPDAHRVGWDGWCGHLIRDRWSMGGGRGEVVICLESPHIRRAIEQYIQREAPGWKKNPELLYNIMAYELQYICYCERSQQMFREWLQQKYQDSVKAVNACWKTEFKSFDQIAAPPTKHAVPLPGTNRAQWLDWACFNQERLTRHLAWVKGVMRKFGAETPITSGGSSSMLAGSNGTSGIDEELLISQVNDIVLQEGGGSTLGTDLEWAFALRKMPLADPELAGSVRDLLPQFLHGKSVMQLYYWPSQPNVSYPRGNGAAIPYSWRWPLNDVAELLRVALDIRRLNKEIAAFASAQPEAAILYSKTSVIQVPPELMRARSTPYLDELGRVYEGSLCLDANTTFITEKQILKGMASRYKVILVPAAKHLPPEVAQALLDYVQEGGHLVVTPESLMTDQYLRPLDFFDQIGVRILNSSAASGYKLGALEQQYDQTMRQSISSGGAATREITTLPSEELGGTAFKLNGRGVVQTLKAGEGNAVLARFTDGRPAMVRHTRGRGKVYCLAMPLEPSSYARVLDRLFEHAEISRPVRFTDSAGRRIGQVEGRSLHRDGEWLLYLVNHGGKTEMVKLALPVKAQSLTDLRRGSKLTPEDLIALEPGETRLIRVS